MRDPFRPPVQAHFNLALAVILPQFGALMLRCGNFQLGYGARAL